MSAECPKHCTCSFYNYSSSIPTCPFAACRHRSFRTTGAFLTYVASVHLSSKEIPPAVLGRPQSVGLRLPDLRLQKSRLLQTLLALVCNPRNDLLASHMITHSRSVVVCFLGTRLHSSASLFLKIRNPKSQSTNLAGSLDGAPIVTQSRRHKPCSKIEVSYSAHSQLAFDASLLFTDCQRDCDCDLRFARCCAVALRGCAAAVRSHNTTPPLRPRRGLTHLGGRHNVELEQAQTP